MQKILIFTAGFGEGHNTAARNIRDGLEYLSADEAQVEIIDLFDSCYGKFNDLMRKAYVTAINKTPKLWQGFYHFLDNTRVVESNLVALARMRRALEDLLLDVQPDAVVSTYPIYGYLIDQIYSNGREKNFTHLTMVTDSISINSLWHRCSSDYFIVPNEATAEVLRTAGVEDDKIKSLGFPVQLVFAEPSSALPLPDLAEGERPRILYIVNANKKKAPHIVEMLLEHRDWDITITVGRDAQLQKTMNDLTADASDRVRVLGWTNQMPQLLLSHHVVISKAGGATVQEAIAGQCPMIVNQVVPGQEEGNYELLRQAHAGALAEKPREIIDWLERAFADHGKLWSLWKKNIATISTPGSSIDIARFILEQAIPENVPLGRPQEHRSFSERKPLHPPRQASTEKRLLLCDFHTHTTYSDGKLTPSEMVDFYGQRGFDALCFTDHLCDPKRLLGKLCNMTGLVLPPDQVEEYFETIEKEKKRAWKKYNLILMTGIEFNKDGYTKKTSAHLLGIDLKKPIDPSLSIQDTIAAIHEQGALAVASHPHEFKSAWGKNTLYFWENQDEYAPLLDAWEVANRDDIYNPVGLKRLPFIANSDFHKPKHIHSWKTVLFCEKDPEAIKQCIRLNRDIAITLYRDHRFAFARQPGQVDQPAAELVPFPLSSSAAA